MPAEKSRRPSPLQRSILVVLAALDTRRPGPVLTRDIERLLEQGGDMPVYGPNLRASCRRMEAAGWLRTLRAPNLQLAVELTEPGRALAAPLLAAEQAAEAARQQAATVLVLPGSTENRTAAPEDRPVCLDGIWYPAWRADFVLRLDGGTCLQLWDAAGQVTRLEGAPLQVARWLHACHAAGLSVRTQINESHLPEQGVRQPEEVVCQPEQASRPDEQHEREQMSRLLDALAQRQLFCDRERLTVLVFSPYRDAAEPWYERLRWLLASEVAGQFGFHSEVSRQEDHALDWLAGYVGREAVEQLAGVVTWKMSAPAEKP